MSDPGAIDWKSPPYSALCILRSSAGDAVGWLAAPDRLVTAGHVLNESDFGSLEIMSAYGKIDFVAAHFDDFAKSGSPGNQFDYGTVEVANVQAGCKPLNMVVPPPNYRGPCYILAYNFGTVAPIWRVGNVVFESDVRFLHSVDTASSFSGGAVVIAAPAVGWTAIGIHTDGSRKGNVLSDDPGGEIVPGRQRYQIATSLGLNLQQKIKEAST